MIRDTDSQIEEAQALLQAAALGHTYSKWCYGLNLLSGRGTEKNESQGIALIRQAAKENFGGFNSDAYAQGTYGFPKSQWANTLERTSQEVLYVG